MRVWLPSLALLTAFTTSLRAGNVHVVDINGTGHTQIQSGVDAAVDGDVVLVKSGIYASFVVPNKGIAIVADSGENVRIQGAIRARHLAADKSLLLSGLLAEGAYVPALIERRGLFLIDMQGHVRVQRCVIAGASAIPCATPDTVHGWTAAHVERCADVAFLDCIMRGGRGGATGNGAVGGSGAGIHATASNVTLHDCLVAGGDGQQCCEGANGGPGMTLLDASIIRAFDTPISAGDGANAVVCPPCSYGGWGGSGLYVRELSAAWLIGSPVQAGSGGWGHGGLWCTDVDGDDGQTIDADSGAFLYSPPWELRTLAAPSIVRAGTAVTFGFEGLEGERIDLMLSPQSGFRPQLDWQGVVQVDELVPRRRLIVGQLPASGKLQFPVELPLPPGQQARVVHAQALYTGTVHEVGQSRISSARSIVVLDPAY